ncbi:MAG: CAP domain-containing protein [Cyanosarcina radialis HA8281-LM2]|jgi:uncharacterized protein YkwD|nr:CAP domain-containing protein [Cyanosarcina radialis HA8281-LM2]
MLKRLFADRRAIAAILTGSLVACDSPIVDRLPINTPKPISANALERAVHEQVNQYRQSRNLPPLTLDPRMSQVAREHAQAMAEGKAPFSHQGFKERIVAISIPYRTAAENLAFNQGYSQPDRSAVEGWIKSPGHRQNMEGNFNLTGIGVTQNANGEYYFTQLFIRS